MTRGQDGPAGQRAAVTSSFLVPLSLPCNPFALFYYEGATQWRILYVSLVPFCNDGKSEFELLNLCGFFFSFSFLSGGKRE